MGCVQQAVLDFDEEIQAPWRPRLVAVAAETGSARALARRPHPSGRSSARVGVCRPQEPAPIAAGSERRGAGSSRDRGEAARWTVAIPAVPVPRRGARRSVSARSGVSGLRLTRRARRLSAILALAVGVAIGSWLGPLFASGSEDFRLAGVQSVVVQPGDTLWSIAADAAGTDDVREVVDRIQELNGLQGSVLMPGQVLELP
jgi:nucleoid-associated protein YgaU